MTRCMGLVLLAGGVAAARASDVPFEAERTISTITDSARSVVCGDIDRDGDIDIVVASAADSTVRIFRNNNSAIPTFTAQTAATAINTPVTVSLADIDDDGDPDILVGGQGSADSFSWIQITQGPTGTLSFFTRTIGAADNPASVRAADLDKDGDLDVIGTSITDSSVRWFENDGTPTSGAWTARVITSSSGAINQIVPHDIDEDGDIDIACASSTGVLWLENDGSPSAGWVVRTAASGLIAEGVLAGDVNGDGRPDIVSISLADDSARFHKSNGASPPAFTTTVIGPGLSNPTDLDLADLDLDGDLDVVLVNASTLGVQWLENNGALNPIFTLRTIPATISQYTGVAVSDLDDDGNPDIVVASASDDRTAWLRSDQIHRSFKFENEPQSLGTVANPIFAMGTPRDIDGDGDVDMLIGTSEQTLWYPNNGAGGFGAGIELAPGFGFSVFVVRPEAIDIDCDGDLDVGGECLALTVANPGVFWRENDGTPGGGSWTKRSIDSDVIDIGFVEGIRMGDLTGDGAPEAVSINSGALVQSLVVYLNPNPPGILDWQETSFLLNIGPVDRFGVDGFELGDLDGDGDLDIFLGLFRNDTSLSLWYENEGGLDFTERVIEEATMSRPTIIDYDDDGDLDIVGRSRGGPTSVYLNNGLAQPTFTRQEIGGLGGEAIPGDLDLDGDLDLVQVLSGGTLRFVERLSAAISDFRGSQFTAASELEDDAAALGDFDGDGDLDFAAATTLTPSPEVLLFRNDGGQFRLHTETDFNDGIHFLPGARRQPILTIEATHRGRAGDSSAEFGTLKLHWQSSFVSDITDSEFNALISQWFVYGDNGDGVFNRLTDTLLTQVSNTDLENGLTIRTLPENSSTLVPFGGIKRFFVAIEFTPGAHNLPMRRFRVTHNTDPLGPNPSIGQDASVDIDLRLERETSVSTDLIFATCPADLSGSSDPNDPGYGVSDDVADSSDFFFYLDQFEAGNVLIADYTSSSDPQAPGYGVPNGVVDADDFFFYLDLFALGCD